MDFDERLIQLVKNCEILYNKRCSAYKNISLKSKEWQEISETLNSTTDECIRRWKSLRDRYARELKKENQPSGSSAKNQVTWNLFMHIDFLRDHVSPRSTSGNMTLPETFEEGSTEEATTEITSAESDYGFDDPASPMSSTPTPRNMSKKRKLEEVNKVFAEGVATFRDFVKAKMVPPATKTPGEIFGQTVANMLESLNEHHQKEAKISIIKFLLTLQEEEFNVQ
ncbi:hypothetical protein ABEB36_015708 [Hypothenemus hampei]|uniref:MADF domain-containing protein n=1 Tax=Hypothenemus hampei TaxID=57062 RepID=A0ABD1DZ89_HYPHA